MYPLRMQQQTIMTQNQTPNTPPAAKLIRINALLPTDLHDAFAATCLASDRTMSQVLRDLMRAYIRAQA